MAGTVIRMAAEERLPDRTINTDLVIYVDGDSLRLDAGESSQGDEGSLIYRSDSQELIAIDHTTREYVVLDRGSIMAMADQVSSALREAEMALEQLPPEQQEFARQMLRQQFGEVTEAPAPRDFRKGAGEESVAGLSCETYDILEQGARSRELCVADWSQVTGGDDIRPVIESMAGFFEDMRSAFSRDGFDLMGPRSDVFSHMRDIEGFPVRSADFDDTGGVTNEMRFKSSEIRDIDASLMRPPAGYREQVIR